MKSPFAVWFLLFLAVTAAWQEAYCLGRAGGDWSALFFTGALRPQPPGLRRGYTYPGSTGYDGQMYRIIAHDPLLRRGYARYLDDPQLRYRRILIPAAAALAGGRSPAAVDFWYIAITDVLLACGGAWFLALARGLAPPWTAAAMYLALPAVVASTDRMVLDGPMLAMALGAWVYFRERRWRPMLLWLAAAPLIRETGVLVTAGVALALAVERRYGRALWAGISAAPFLVWAWWLAGRTPPSPLTSQLSVPLWPQIMRLAAPVWRPAAGGWNPALRFLDALALVCLLATFAGILLAAGGEIRAGGLKRETGLVLPMAVAAACFSGPTLLGEPYDFLRYISLPAAWLELRLLPLRPRLAFAYALTAGLALLAYRGAIVVRLAGR